MGGKEDEVIHFTGQEKKKSMCRIESCTLKNFCKRSQLRLVCYGVSYFEEKVKFPGTCHKEESDCVEIVLARARHYSKHPYEWPEYNHFTNNCEHFAFFCKTGTKVFNSDGQGGHFESLAAKNLFIYTS